MSYVEAVVLIDGKEQDSIDPVQDITSEGNTLLIGNGFHWYEFEMTDSTQVFLRLRP